MELTSYEARSFMLLSAAAYTQECIEYSWFEASMKIFQTSLCNQMQYNLGQYKFQFPVNPQINI